MRSIGKKNINLVIKLVRSAQSEGLTGGHQIFEYVKGDLPSSVFETWEGAYTQIENIVWDAVMNSPVRSKFGGVF